MNHIMIPMNFIIDANDIDTPVAPAATGKTIVFKSSGSASNVKHAHDEMQ